MELTIKEIEELREKIKEMRSQFPYDLVDEYRSERNKLREKEAQLSTLLRTALEEWEECLHYVDAYYDRKWGYSKELSSIWKQYYDIIDGKTGNEA